MSIIKTGSTGGYVESKEEGSSWLDRLAVAAPAPYSGPVFGGSAPAPSPAPYSGPVFGGGGMPSTSVELNDMAKAAIAILGGTPAATSAASLGATAARMATGSSGPVFGGSAPAAPMPSAPVPSPAPYSGPVFGGSAPAAPMPSAPVPSTAPYSGPVFGGSAPAAPVPSSPVPVPAPYRGPVFGGSAPAAPMPSAPVPSPAAYSGPVFGGSAPAAPTPSVLAAGRGGSVDPTAIARARADVEEAAGKSFVARQARDKARLTADYEKKRLASWDNMRNAHLLSGSAGWSESAYEAVKASAQAASETYAAALQAYSQAEAAQNAAQAVLDALLPPPSPAPVGLLTHSGPVFGGGGLPTPAPAPYVPPVAIAPPPPPPPSPAQLAAQAKVNALADQLSMQTTALASAMSAEAYAKTSMYRWNTMRDEHRAAHGSLDASTGWSESDYQSILATAARTQVEAEKANILRNTTLYDLRAAQAELSALEPPPVYASGVVFGGGGVPSTTRAEPDAHTRAILAMLGGGRPEPYKEPSSVAAPAPAPVTHSGPVFGGGGVPAAASKPAALSVPPRERPQKQWDDIKAVWDDRQDEPALLMDLMRQFGFDAADLAYATGQSVAAVGSYLIRHGADDGFAGWSATRGYEGTGRIAAAAAAAPSTPALIAPPRERPQKQWDDIKAVWDDRQDEPALLMDLMRQFGFDAADLAYATGQSVAAVGGYLIRHGADDGFAGWSATRGYEGTGRVQNTPKGPPLSVPPRERPQKQWDDIKAVWDDRQDEPALLMDLMRQFGFDAADLAYATGQSVADVGSYLIRNGAADGFAGWSATRGYEGTGRVVLANGAPRERPQKQWDDIKAVWEDRKDEPYRLMQLMTSYGFDAKDLAFVSGQTELAIGDYLTLNGAPAGFGGPATVGRAAVDEPYLAALNEALSRNGDRSDFDFQEFTTKYVSQNTPQAQAFARIHGVEVVASGAGVVAFTQSRASLVAANQISFNESGDTPSAKYLWTGSRISWAANDTAIRDYLSYPVASEGERTQLELLFYNPVNIELLREFGHPRAKKKGLFEYSYPSELPNNEQTDRMRARYGEELASKLLKLDLAAQNVRDAYSQAMIEARSKLFPGRTIAPEGTMPGVSVDETRRFDLKAFHEEYVKRDTPASRLFVALYGSDLTLDQSGAAYVGEGGEFAVSPGVWLPANEDGVGVHRRSDSIWYPPKIGFSNKMGEMGLVRVSLDHPPSMFDKNLVFFEPTFGFVTLKENIKPETDWVDTLFPLLMVAAVSWITAGAGSAVAGSMGLTTTAAGVTTLTTTGTIVAAGVTGGIASIASGLVNDNLSLKGVLKGMFTSALTAGLMEGLKGLNAGVLKDLPVDLKDAINFGGKVAIRTAVNAIAGGGLKDGLASALASGVAESLMGNINQAIAKGELTPIEAVGVRTLATTFKAALRILADPSNPGRTLASAFIDDLFSQIDPPKLGATVEPTVQNRSELNQADQALAHNRTMLNVVNQISDPDYYAADQTAAETARLTRDLTAENRSVPAVEGPVAPKSFRDQWVEVHSQQNGVNALQQMAQTQRTELNQALAANDPKAAAQKADELIQTLNELNDVEVILVDTMSGLWDRDQLQLQLQRSREQRDAEVSQLEKRSVQQKLTDAYRSQEHELNQALAAKDWKVAAQKADQMVQSLNQLKAAEANLGSTTVSSGDDARVKAYLQERRDAYVSHLEKLRDQMNDFKVLTVQSGDRLESLARQIYGADWRAGMQLMGQWNDFKFDSKGNPILRVDATLTAPSLYGLSQDELTALNKAGGNWEAKIAKNTQIQDYNSKVQALNSAKQVADERVKDLQSLSMSDPQAKAKIDQAIDALNQVKVAESAWMQSSKGLVKATVVEGAILGAYQRDALVAQLTQAKVKAEVATVRAAPTAPSSDRPIDSENKAGVFSRETLAIPFAGVGNTADTYLSFAAAGLASLFKQSEDADAIFRDLDERIAARNQWANPDNKEQTFGGKLAGVVATLPMQVVAAAMTPAQTSKQLIDNGESLDVATHAFREQTFANLASVVVPGAVGGSWFTKAVTGGGINVLLDEVIGRDIANLGKTEATKTQFIPTWESRAISGIIGAATGPLADLPRSHGVDVPARGSKPEFEPAMWPDSEGSGFDTNWSLWPDSYFGVDGKLDVAKVSGSVPALGPNRVDVAVGVDPYPTIPAAYRLPPSVVADPMLIPQGQRGAIDLGALDGPGSSEPGASVRLGDLRPEEIAAIQAGVDRLGGPVFVTGSAVSGTPSSIVGGPSALPKSSVPNIITAGPTSVVTEFGPTVRNEGWGVLDTRTDPVIGFVDEITAGYNNVSSRNGKEPRPGQRFGVAGVAGSSSADSIHLSPEATSAVQAWANRVLVELQALMPDEPLEIEYVSVGRGWNLTARDADGSPTPAIHVDQNGTYLHATNTLRGASTNVFPHATSQADPGPALVPPEGTTVVISGADRRVITKGEVTPTLHSSPLDPGAAPQDRVTLFLGIRNRDVEVLPLSQVMPRVDYDFKWLANDIRKFNDNVPGVWDATRIGDLRHSIDKFLSRHASVASPSQRQIVEDALQRLQPLTAPHVVAVANRSGSSSPPLALSAPIQDLSSGQEPGIVFPSAQRGGIDIDALLSAAKTIFNGLLPTPPGRFVSAEDAARAAAREYSAISQAENREYGGYIYEVKEGLRRTIGFTVQAGDSRSVFLSKDQVPPGARLLGDWHTHPGVSITFSPTDIAAYHHEVTSNPAIKNYTSYVVTQEGLHSYRVSDQKISVVDGTMRTVEGLDTLGDYDVFAEPVRMIDELRTVDFGRREGFHTIDMAGVAPLGGADPQTAKVRLIFERINDLDGTPNGFDLTRTRSGSVADDLSVLREGWPSTIREVGAVITRPKGLLGTDLGHLLDNEYFLPSEIRAAHRFAQDLGVKDYRLYLRTPGGAYKVYSTESGAVTTLKDGRVTLMPTFESTLRAATVDPRSAEQVIRDHGVPLIKRFEDALGQAAQTPPTGDVPRTPTFDSTVQAGGLTNVELSDLARQIKDTNRNIGLRYQSDVFDALWDEGQVPLAPPSPDLAFSGISVENLENVMTHGLLSGKALGREGFNADQIWFGIGRPFYHDWLTLVIPKQRLEELGGVANVGLNGQQGVMTIAHDKVPNGIPFNQFAVVRVTPGGYVEPIYIPAHWQGSFGPLPPENVLDVLGRVDTVTPVREP